MTLRTEIQIEIQFQTIQLFRVVTPWYTFFIINIYTLA